MSGGLICVAGRFVLGLEINACVEKASIKSSLVVCN